jgi:hypothetical protein
MKTLYKTIHAEWQDLNNHFDKETVSIWFNNFNGYNEAREKATLKQIIEILNQYK